MEFPRSIDRGLIEAPRGQDIRRVEPVVFPRSIDRGLIEAAASRPASSRAD